MTPRHCLCRRPLIIGRFFVSATAHEPTKDAANTHLGLLRWSRRAVDLIDRSNPGITVVMGCIAVRHIC